MSSPAQRLGDYEILDVLGAGGMGRVYRVRNVLTDRIEAMKVLLPNLQGHEEVAARFLREIKVLANLEQQELDVEGAPILARREGKSAGAGQYLLFSADEELAIEKLRAVDVNQLTPLAALSLLAALQDRLKGK